MSTASNPAYVPGVCNINRAEIASRRKAGYFGAGLFVLAAAVLLVLQVSRWYRLVLFVPAFIAAIGFLQAKNKFCVSYAASGQQNASEDGSGARKITDAGAHDKDKSRARRMNSQAAAFALLACVLMLLIP